MEELIKFIEDEIKIIDASLKENSWNNCDDDEEPDINQRKKDQDQKEAYEKILKFINKIK